MNKTLKTITLGCRLNSYESNKISNFTNCSSKKDILVINTCAVTAEAERQARQEIRKARKEFRGDKKQIRKNKRKAKRNRKGK